MHAHHPILTSVAPPPRIDAVLWRSVKRYLVQHSLLPQPANTMCTPEQRNNIYLLADQVLGFGIPGDFVELGCYEGNSARVIASVLQYEGADRNFHVYDSFEWDRDGTSRVRDRFEQSFRSNGLPLPIVHQGDFYETLPKELPERIAFAHIDCGTGGLPHEHSMLVRRCLESVYPRMSTGAIGVLMDYHDPERTVDGWDCNPGMKAACDVFFRGKPECIHILYGNGYSHAFFRKHEAV